MSKIAEPSVEEVVEVTEAVALSRTLPSAADSSAAAASSVISSTRGFGVHERGMPMSLSVVPFSPGQTDVLNRVLPFEV